MEEKIIRKSTIWNVLASIAVILFMVAVTVNGVLVKFDLLGDLTQGKLYATSWTAEYADEQLADFAFANIVSYLPAIGIALAAFVLLLVPICLAKHGKGWNWIPLLLVLADTCYYAYRALGTSLVPANSNIATYLKEIFAAPGEKWLTAPDINLMLHVLVLLLLTFGAAKGTKKVIVVSGAAEGEVAEEVVEQGPVYRTITLTRKLAPFAHFIPYEVWFNGEKVCEINDGQKKSFYVDQYGADLVVVSPSGEDSNTVVIPEGTEDGDFEIISTRDVYDTLYIDIAQV